MGVVLVEVRKSIAHAEGEPSETSPFTSPSLNMDVNLGGQHFDSIQHCRELI